MGKPHPSTSAIFRFAAQLRSDMLEEYRLVQEHEYEAACAATNGYMTTQGKDSWWVFNGPPNVVKAYATPELLEYLRSHPRTTRTSFETQWLSANVTY